jgi:hypothetical protein
VNAKELITKLQDLVDKHGDKSVLIDGNYISEGSIYDGPVHGRDPVRIDERGHVFIIEADVGD